MTRQMKRLMMGMAVAVACTLPVASYATSLAPVFTDTTFVPVSGCTGSEDVCVAEIQTTIFGTDAAMATQAEREAADARFAYVTPSVDDHTYFYQITNIDLGTFSTLDTLRMNLPFDMPAPSNAFTLLGDGSTINAAFTPGSVFEFAGMVFKSPGSVAFDLNDIFVPDSVDAVLTTPFVPHPDTNATTLETGGGSSQLLSLSLVGPDAKGGQEKDAVPAPEPGILLLLGSGLLGLGAFARSRLKH